MTRILALLLLAFAAPVSAQTADTTFMWWNPQQRTPNTMHSLIYEMTQRCMGIEGEPFGELRWYSADFVLRIIVVHPPERADSIVTERLGGLWIREPRMVVFDEERFNSPEVVAHELGHDVLRNGTGHDHDNPVFQRCQIGALAP